ALLQSLSQCWIGVMIKFEQAAHCVPACRLQTRRRPRQYRRRSARDQRRNGTNRKGVLAADATSCLEAHQRAVKPPGLTARPREPAFQDILSIEVRSIAIGRCDCMYDHHLSGLVHAVETRHGRVERKETVER